MKDKEIFKTVRNYEDGEISSIECLLKLFDVLSEEMKIAEEIEMFLKDMSYGRYIDDFYIAGKLLYFSKKLNLK